MPSYRHFTEEELAAIDVRVLEDLRTSGKPTISDELFWVLSREFSEDVLLTQFYCDGVVKEAKGLWTAHHEWHLAVVNPESTVTPEDFREEWLELRRQMLKETFDLWMEPPFQRSKWERSCLF